MARSEADQNAIYQKIVFLNKNEGFPWVQATAIALRMYRAGELRSTTVNKRAEKRKQQKPPTPPTDSKYKSKRKKNTTSRDALIALILKAAVESIGNNEERFIQGVATVTMQPIEIIKQQYELGKANWKVFHRPGVTIEEAAREQVYRYILNG